MLQNENILFRWRRLGESGFCPGVSEEGSVQGQLRPGERVSDHGQRWLHKGLQRDVSEASVFISCTVFVLVLNLRLFV